ncbi:hypothetical protein MT418_005324 [Batrachochytrium dendrobatidis]
MSSHIAFSMAGICAIGGTAGYIKGRSIPSLVAGLGFGALMAGAGYFDLAHINYTLVSS